MTRLPLPLPGSNPVGFPPLQRPHGPPPHPPLPRTCGPLWRPRIPPRRPTLLRTRQPGFPAGQRSSPLALASPHGATMLPPRRRLWRWPSQYRPHQPPRLMISLPCRCPVSTLPSTSASRCPTPPPPRSSPPSPSPIPPIPRRSTRRFCLRSPLCSLPPRGTPSTLALLTWCWCLSCPCPPRAWTVVAVVVAVVHISAPGMPIVLPSPSLFLPPAPPPATDQRASPPFLTGDIGSWGLGGRGVWGGASGCRIPRDGGGGRRQSREEEWEERNEDKRRARGRDKVDGSENGDNGPGKQSIGTGPPTGKKFRSRGGVLRGGVDKKESADENDGWSGADLEGSVTEEEATEEEVKTAEGAGWDCKTRTETAGGMQEIGTEGRSGDELASRGNTRKASSTAADKARSGGATGQDLSKGGGLQTGRKTQPASLLECGATKGATMPPEWPTSPWEWGTRRGEANPPEWRKPMGVPPGSGRGS